MAFDSGALGHYERSEVKRRTIKQKRNEENLIKTDMRNLNCFTLLMALRDRVEMYYSFLRLLKMVTCFMPCREQDGMVIKYERVGWQVMLYRKLLVETVICKISRLRASNGIDV